MSTDAGGYLDRQIQAGIPVHRLPAECLNQTGVIRVTNEGDILVCPHKGQQEALNAPERYVFILSGSQAGKTSIGPIWLEQEIYGKTDKKTGKVVRAGRGSGDYLAVTASYDLFNMKMLPELTRYFCDYLGDGRYHPGPKVIELKDPDTDTFWAKTAKDDMWGRIILRSAKTGTGSVGVSRLEAATAKAAWLDECGMDDFTIAAFESVKRRLRIHRGRILGTTTIYNHGWLHSEIYIPFTQGAKDIRVIQFESILNPAFPLDEYEEARRTMPGWKFDMQYRGIFTRPAGAIYGDFDERIHVCNPITIHTHWPVIVGIDPGAVNTAVIYLGIHPDTKDIYLFRESLEGNLTSAEHARRAMDPLLAYMYVDWFGGAKSETQFRMDWQTAGVPVQEPLVNDVEGGIDRVIALLKGGKFRVFRTCTQTITQLRQYSRELDTSGQPTEKIRNKESYHLLDALRYAASGIPTGWEQPTIAQMTNNQPIPGFGTSGRGFGGMRL